MSEERYLARSVWLRDVKNSSWQGDFVKVGELKVYRVQVVGTVVQKYKSEDGNYSFITVDDGSDNIRVKAWREDALKLSGIEPGAIVRVVGGLSNYNNELYVSPIAVKRVHPHEWLHHVVSLGGHPLKRKNKKDDDSDNVKKVRSDERAVGVSEVAGKGVKKVQGEGTPKNTQDSLNSKKSSTNQRTSLLKLIRSLDAGKGAELDLIVSASDLERSKIIEVLKELMDGGEVFEPAPNRLKVLD